VSLRQHWLFSGQELLPKALVDYLLWLTSGWLHRLATSFPHLPLIYR